MKPEFKNEEERLAAFELLRAQTHKRMEKEVKEREERNPVPSEEEAFLGAFAEMLEPQVRDAAIAMVKKGYMPESSGFYGDHETYQAIDGYFDLTQTESRAVEESGGNVLSSDQLGFPGFGEIWQQIRFDTESPDLEAMKRRWDAIAEALPARSESAPPSVNGDFEFLQKYAPTRTDIEAAVLKRRLAVSESHPDVVKEMEERIAKIESGESTRVESS